MGGCSHMGTMPWSVHSFGPGTLSTLDFGPDYGAESTVGPFVTNLPAERHVNRAERRKAWSLKRRRRHAPS